jgi:S-DNA-T family DNA segregation ATPase FtsK/SpoIIIE
MRALTSIKAELRRRQQIFGDYDVTMINQYTKMFREGKTKEPLPHLFIISDEFAELKKEQPEFMKELVSAARIGRSLGVHLILATQKPAGVVDDQIWSNSKFKLALKVQNENDSNEVLKTPDAARITQVGRAILQVGNNEIYEMFQSAWSGATYTGDIVKQEVDKRIFQVNALGQLQLINDDVNEKLAPDKEEISQLAATVNYIHDVYATLNLAPIKKPWLPPLTEMMVSPHYAYDAITDVGLMHEMDIKVPIGVVDIPEQQLQTEYIHDFSKDGNLAIFSAPGFGKTTVMMQICMYLATHNSPRNVKYYLLDLGNAGLMPLRNLPHTADYITFEDETKMRKMWKILQEEITKRKNLFAKKNAMNIMMYNELMEDEVDKVPAIFLFIDNYDVLREINMELENIVTKISRDGMAMGIFSIIAPSRSTAVKFAVMNTFKQKICNYMIDPSEASSIVGRSDNKLVEKKGRALVKIEEVLVMQEYLPVPYESDVLYTKDLIKLVNQINERCTAPRAKGIGMMPEFLHVEELLRRKKEETEGSTQNKIALGLETEEIEVQYKSQSINVLTILGTPQTGKTNLIKLILSQMVMGDYIFLVDSANMDLITYRHKTGVNYLGETKELDGFKQKFAQLVNDREQAFNETEHGFERPRDFYRTLPGIWLFIDGLDNFMTLLGTFQTEFTKLFDKALTQEMHVICTCPPGKLMSYTSNNLGKTIRDTQDMIYLGNPKGLGITTVPTQYSTNYVQHISSCLHNESDSYSQLKLPYVP